ncbi:hypothetical protein ACFLZ1_02410 [Patescibacteria group bacterium]
MNELRPQSELPAQDEEVTLLDRLQGLAEIGRCIALNVLEALKHGWTGEAGNGEDKGSRWPDRIRACIPDSGKEHGYIYLGDSWDREDEARDRQAG